MARVGTIQFFRGNVGSMPTLFDGEPAFTEDTFDLYIGDGVTNHKIGLRWARSAKTANYTVVAGDSQTVIDCTANTFTVAFTAAATLGSGFIFGVMNSGTGVITLDPNSTEKIIDAANPTGATTLSLAQGESKLLMCNGSNFEVLASEKASSGGASVGNPAGGAQVDLTGANGSAATALRTDCKLILDQSIVPTWTGNHLFHGSTKVKLGSSSHDGPLVASAFDDISAVTVGTSEADIFTHTIDASALASNGDSLLWVIGGDTTTSGPNMEWKVKFDGTTAWDSGTPSGISHWAVRVLVTRLSSTTAQVTAWLTADVALSTQIVKSSTITVTNFTASRILKITGQTSGLGAGNNLTGRHAKMFHVPAA